MYLRPLFLLLAFLAPVCLPPASAQPAPDKPSFTRTIYLIRHGAYDISVRGDEEKMNALTPLGIAEARLVAARLRGMPVTFDTLVSSTYTRARQTADVINEMLPSLHRDTTKLLCECMPRTREAGAMAGVPPEDIDASEKQLAEAFDKYFAPATDRDRHDVLVCHGNVIRFLLAKALDVPTDAWLSLNIAHCSLSIIQVRADGSCRVLSIGDTGHLPPNLTTGYSRKWPELVLPN